MARVLSPRYPSLSLEEAVAMASKLHSLNLRQPVSREVAAQHLGYSGITGSSDRAISALMHFNLLEKAGKGEVRITNTAVDILHPESIEGKSRALQTAASSPDLFRQLRDRFGEAMPNEDNLKSALSRLGFVASAVGPAANSYLETCRFLRQQNAIESGSVGVNETISSRHDSPSTEGNGDMLEQSAPAHVSMAEPSATVSSMRLGGEDLNDIRVEIAGGKVRVQALLDKEGLAKLKKKIDALEMLIGDDDEQFS